MRAYMLRSQSVRARMRFRIHGAVRSESGRPMPDHVPRPDFPLLGWCTAAVLVAFALLWRRQTATNNATSVDFAWAATIGMLGAAFAGLGAGSPIQRGLAAGIALLWSGRLCWHLLRDRILVEPGGAAVEDGRYRALRAHWGAKAPRNFFWFYQAQAIAAVVFAVPFLLLSANPVDKPEPLQFLGLALAGFGIGLETIADRQLATHRRDPARRGQTCRRGLWRWSRHPNYFGEWLCWCGIALVALPAPLGSLALVQPVLMFVLVRFVSGVPFAELQARKSRGDDYARYMRETNAFFPWWPRRPQDNPA